MQAVSGSARPARVNRPDRSCVVLGMTLDAVVAANRFGLGARPGELERVARRCAWLARRSRSPARAPLPEEIRRLPSSAEVFKTYSELRRERNDAKSDSEAAKRLLGGLRAKLAPYYLDQVAARYRVAVQDRRVVSRAAGAFLDQPFRGVGRQAAGARAGRHAGERSDPAARRGSIRRHAAAVESHPAMILYLDNQASIGPASQLAQRRGRRASASDRKLGINENLAREILELHTLGVDGGYTQQDVTTFARALTGWSIGTDRFRRRRRARQVRVSRRRARAGRKDHPRQALRSSRASRSRAPC